MAIVIAPNRRGMPGHGAKWNADISKDWGGQPIRDYLSAIDDISKEPYVDKARLGAVGASYGGYSVFMLAGVHEKRFKTFIAHDGLFDLRSWYGTTEELWFANWDIGAYFNKDDAKSYDQYNPSNFVNNWNAPIMIVQGGIDFRVGIEQGCRPYQAAQLKGAEEQAGSISRREPLAAGRAERHRLAARVLRLAERNFIILTGMRLPGFIPFKTHTMYSTLNLDVQKQYRHHYPQPARRLQCLQRCAQLRAAGRAETNRKGRLRARHCDYRRGQGFQQRTGPEGLTGIHRQKEPGRIAP